jgi:hypothetical protein
MTYLADDALATTKISLYPNPSKGNIAVTYNAKTNANLSFKVYDVFRKSCFQQTSTGVKVCPITYRFDLSKLTPGMYYLEVK